MKKVPFAHLYSCMVMFVVFFVVYITTGDYQHRFLRTGNFDSGKRYNVLVKSRGDTKKSLPTEDSHVHSRKSRLTKSMVGHRHITTTTETWIRPNRTMYYHKQSTSTKSNVNLEELYKLRKNHLERACNSLGTPQLTYFDPRKIQHSILVERKHAILYCNIPKVSSSFWKRTLTVMKEGRFSSPFDVSLAQTSLPTFFNMRKNMYATDKFLMEPFLGNASSFIFVRDPYARLFSGYVNKIYCPNAHYWRRMGTRVAKATRSYPSDMSMKYGHDIKFSEFVNFILKFSEKGFKLDSHFAPMSAKCDPCRMPYDFIGKLETFNRDSTFLMTEWRHKFDDFNISISDFEKESTLDTADLHIRLMMKAWEFIKDSGYPFYYMGLRVWSDLQIRGYMSKTLDFPFRPSEAMYITRESLLVAIRDALNKPFDRMEVKKQREEALIQAYRTVPLADMEKLRKFVSKDCKLFGYDDRPSNLFDRSTPFDVKHEYLGGL